jgi:cytochrome oxidase assembly protein ShyY1
MVSTLILDGLGKWKLKRKFWKEIVVEMDKIEV